MIDSTQQIEVWSREDLTYPYNANIIVQKEWDKLTDALKRTLGVGRDIFRMKKKNRNLPATCHTGIGFNLQNFGMDLFPIIFVNFKTPCLHGNSS